MVASEVDKLHSESCDVGPHVTRAVKPETEVLGHEVRTSATVDLNALIDVRERLALLRKWHADWYVEDQRLAQRAHTLDLNRPVDAQIGVQIAALRRRLRMELIHEPLEASPAQVESVGYLALREHFSREFARLTLEERILWLRNLHFIMTPDLRSLRDKLSLIRDFRSFGQQRCLLLGAASGMGKTTFLDWYVYRHMPSVDLDRNFVPVVKVDAPVSNKSSRSLFRRILLACGKTYTQRADEEELLEKIVLYFQECNVELLVIDEIEHIMRPELKRRLLEISNLTRGVPIVCSSCHPLSWVEGDNEIAGRWNDFYHLHQYTGARLSGLLTYVELLLPFSRPSNLAFHELPQRAGKSRSAAEPGPAQLIERWTGGILRDIMILLMDASTRALKEGLPNITPTLLEATWKQIQTRQVMDFRPLPGNSSHRRAW